MPTDHRHQLGAFVRAQRDRLDPASLGLPSVSRRRTKGLRREEVAQLAGVSATWITWIEQGREVSVSSPALARLAAALRLDRAERAYLFELAGKRDVADAVAPAIESVPPALAEALDRMAMPAYLLDRHWNAVAWNAAAARLFTGWLDGAADRNLLRFVFRSAAARALIRDWPERARRVVAEFRADCGRHLDDPALAALVAELANASAAFAEIWQAHEVLAREGGERWFDHPVDGALKFEQMSFTHADRPDLKLVLLMPLSA
jgi:transcriptional regulator with XRE-family HTH domain